MFGCFPLRVMALRLCQKPVTGPPGSARALDAILIDGLGHGRRAAHAFPRRQSSRLCLHRSPQWVIQARVLI